VLFGVKRMRGLTTGISEEPICPENARLITGILQNLIKNSLLTIRFTSGKIDIYPERRTITK
jgi:hypothetical protein